MKKVVAILCVLVICVMCIPVYGTLSNYSAIVPIFSDSKEVATGNKTNDRKCFRNLTDSFNTAFIGWVEAYDNNEWVAVSDKTMKFYPQNNVTVNYSLIPTEGKQLRFMIKRTPGTAGGYRASGTINFE